MAVGIIYGVPLANILDMHWQETFLALGYIGLILIIFQGMRTFPSRRYGIIERDVADVEIGVRWSRSTTGSTSEEFTA